MAEVKQDHKSEALLLLANSLSATDDYSRRQRNIDRAQVHATLHLADVIEKANEDK